MKGELETVFMKIYVMKRLEATCHVEMSQIEDRQRLKRTGRKRLAEAVSLKLAHGETEVRPIA